MKSIRLALTTTAIVVFLFMPLSAFGQQIKIASVDMSKIFAEYYKTKKAENDLKDRATGYEKELRQRISELEKMREDAKKLQEDSENPAFTAENKTEKRKILENKVTEGRLYTQQLQEFKLTHDRELEQQKNQVRSALVEEITKVVQEKGKKEGCTLVIDKAGLTLSGVSPFLFVQDTMDITPDIIKTLNANAPTATPSPSATTPDKKEKK